MVTEFISFVLKQWEEHPIIGPVIFIMLTGFLISEIMDAIRKK